MTSKDSSVMSRKSTVARRVRIPEHLNWWKPKYADWDLPHINITHLVTKFVGNFNVMAWLRSVEMLCDKHPILKCSVEVRPEGAEFILDSRDDKSPRLVEYLMPQGRDQQQAPQQLTSAIVWQPFDPHGGPLFRAFMIRLSSRESILGIVVHHGIADGWSIAIIGRELLAGYVAAATRGETALPAPAVQYLDYVEEVQYWLNGAQARRQKEYWARQMSGSRSVLLPDNDVDLDMKSDWAAERFDMDDGLVGALCTRAAQTRMTPFLLILTANIATMAELARCCDIVVVVVAEQRHDRRLRHTVGLLVNYLPIRVWVNWAESFDELSRRVHATYLEACANQTYPYQLINADNAAFPYFRFRRILDPEGAQKPSHGFQFFELPPPPATRTPARGAAPDLFILHSNHSMSARLRYLPALHMRETAVRFIRVFQQTLAVAAFDSTDSLGAALRIARHSRLPYCSKHHDGNEQSDLSEQHQYPAGFEELDRER